MTNYLDFQKVLFSHVVRYGPFTVSTVEAFIDYPPPHHPGPNAPAHILQGYNSDEKAYHQYKRDCSYTCSLLYNSLSSDVKIRFESNRNAYRAMGLGQLGLMWWYISEIVRETGQNSIMPMFSKIINHKTRNKQTWRQELEELIKSIRTLVSQYPTAEDKTRLWQEFETYAVVSSLSNIPEFETHFQQTVYHLRQWPTGLQIVDAISNLADSMLKL
jgi:hypothetical protein